MERPPCFIYRTGEHFTLPGKFDDDPPKLCEFAVLDETGRPAPNPLVFSRTENPADAAFFIFPWDIGHYVDALMLADMEALISSLPYYKGRERRHIVCDGGDLTDTLSIPARLFKISLTRQNAALAVGSWYDLPEHAAHAAPSFDWSEIRYDCAFVGNLTSPLRKAAVLSLRHQPAGLRLKIDLDDSLYFEGEYYFSRERTLEQQAERQKIYLDATRQSLTVLCPPGIGPHSVRLYETMSLGRIPVLFDNGSVYPFADEVDYAAFCFSLPTAEVINTGALLRERIASRSPEELHEMCAKACRAWNKYLSPKVKLPKLLNAANAKWPR